MKRLLRLMLLAGLAGALWAWLRQQMEASERSPMQRVGDVVGSVGDAAKSGATSVTTGGNGTADLSKAELYREAQKLEVEGRSKMSKDELADAVSKARRGGGS